MRLLALPMASRVESDNAIIACHVRQHPGINPFIDASRETVDEHDRLAGPLSDVVNPSTVRRERTILGPQCFVNEQETEHDQQARRCLHITSVHSAKSLSAQLGREKPRQGVVVITPMLFCDEAVD
jgi:hypothetical protein